MDKGVKNILKVLSLADETDISEGRVAYFRYREVCQQIAVRYDYPLAEVVAVFVALSPNSDYKGNLRSALSVIEGHKNGRELQSIKVSTYNHCRDRAFTYLNGVSFLETVRGPKIRAFYQNILNPLDALPVTMDGHAVNIWRGERTPLKGVKRFDYEAIADDYRHVARSVHLLPNQIQAITWFTWKRIHRIFWKPRQFDLFTDKSQDFWETLSTLENVSAF